MSQSSVAAIPAPIQFSPSQLSKISGRLLSALAIVFLLFDATIKVLQLPVAVDATKQLGYSGNIVLTLGAIQLICLALYLIPRTAIFGAILWTGYLGGAVATHVRVGNPLATHILFPIYVAALLWGGLWLRDQRLRELLPLRSARV